MKKYFLNFILIFILILLCQKSVYAQSVGVSVPGVDCGNAEGTGSARNCCKPIDTSLSIPGVVKAIPVVGPWITNLNETMLKLRDYTNIVPCPIGYPDPNPKDPNCICIPETQITASPIQAVKKMCRQYLTTKEKNDCEGCADKGGYWTSMGCVYGDLSKFIMETVFGLGTGLAGLIALACIIFSSVQLQTSQGNPEKIKKAQELLTSCISGLILIIFSIFILRLIGVEILKIPFFK